MFFPNKGLDIEEKECVKKEQDKSLETLQAIVDATMEGIFVFDEHKKCIYANKATEKILGYTKAEILGKEILEFISEEFQELVRNHMLEANNKEPYEIVILNKDGQIPVLIRCKDVNLYGKKIRISAFWDISSLKKKEEEILYLAHHDRLTSLPNRFYLEQELPNFRQRSLEHKSYSAMLFIDLDKFKIINDTQGHAVGDKVLIEVAHRLRASIRSIDIVSRIGGDEFIILLDACESNKKKAVNNLLAMADKLLNIIREPMCIGKNQFTLGASIGVSLFSGTSQTFYELMRCADNAMYKAKNNGKDKVVFFDPALCNKN